MEVVIRYLKNVEYLARLVKYDIKEIITKTSVISMNNIRLTTILSLYKCFTINLLDDSLPLNDNVCVYCIHSTLNNIPCEECEYAKVHGECDVADSDYRIVVDSIKYFREYINRFLLHYDFRYYTAKNDKYTKLQLLRLYNTLYTTLYDHYIHIKYLLQKQSNISYDYILKHKLHILTDTIRAIKPPLYFCNTYKSCKRCPIINCNKKEFNHIKHKVINTIINCYV